MSDIQLSAQLVQDIEAAVLRQQADADKGVVLQYLAAAMGYLLGQQRGLSDEEKAGYMDELCAFARHVLEDVQQRARQQSQAATKAFGYWVPPGR
jgi:hypothetical protein